MMPDIRVAPDVRLRLLVPAAQLSRRSGNFDRLVHLLGKEIADGTRDRHRDELRPLASSSRHS